MLNPEMSFQHLPDVPKCHTCCFLLNDVAFQRSQTVEPQLRFRNKNVLISWIISMYFGLSIALLSVGHPLVTFVRDTIERLYALSVVG